MSHCTVAVKERDGLFFFCNLSTHLPILLASLPESGDPDSHWPQWTGAKQQPPLGQGVLALACMTSPGPHHLRPLPAWPPEGKRIGSLFS